MEVYRGVDVWLQSFLISTADGNDLEAGWPLELTWMLWGRE
jgi:hypothetical protein